MGALDARQQRAPFGDDRRGSEKEFGYHVHHWSDIDSLARANLDYARVARTADYVIPICYHSLAARRFVEPINQLQQTLMRDADPLNIAKVLFREHGFNPAWLGDDLATFKEEGTLGTEYVAHEVGRAVRDCRATTNRRGRGHCKVFAGVGFDVCRGNKFCREDTGEDPAVAAAAVRAAIAAGVEGLFLSRGYPEIHLGNMRIVGATLRADGHLPN